MKKKYFGLKLHLAISISVILLIVLIFINTTPTLAYENADITLAKTFVSGSNSPVNLTLLTGNLINYDASNITPGDNEREIVKSLSDVPENIPVLVVASSNASLEIKSQANYSTNGVNDSQVIQTAINSLSHLRNRIETVKCIGLFTLKSGILIPSYTRLDLTEATFILDNATNTSMISNSNISEGNTNIQIIGGRLYGNRQGQTEGFSRDGIDLRKVTDSSIEGTYITLCKENGIFIGDNSYRINVVGVIAEKNGSGQSIRGNGFYEKLSANIYYSNDLATANVMDGFCFDQGSTDTSLEQCKSQLNGATGVTIYTDSSSNCENITINNNIIQSNGDGGIQSNKEGKGDGLITALTITNNQIRDNGRTGMWLSKSFNNTISNNTIINNNCEGGKTQYDGICVACVNSVFSENIVNTRHQYGIREVVGYADGNTYENNNLKGNILGNNLYAGTNHILINN